MSHAADVLREAWRETGRAHDIPILLAATVAARAGPGAAIPADAGLRLVDAAVRLSLGQAEGTDALDAAFAGLSASWRRPMVVLVEPWLARWDAVRAWGWMRARLGDDIGEAGVVIAGRAPGLDVCAGRDATSIFVRERAARDEARAVLAGAPLTGPGPWSRHAWLALAVRDPLGALALVDRMLERYDPDELAAGVHVLARGAAALGEGALVRARIADAYYVLEAIGWLHASAWAGIVKTDVVTLVREQIARIAAELDYDDEGWAGLWLAGAAAHAGSLEALEATRAAFQLWPLEVAMTVFEMRAAPIIDELLASDLPERWARASSRENEDLVLPRWWEHAGPEQRTAILRAILALGREVPWRWTPGSVGEELGIEALAAGG